MSFKHDETRNSHSAGSINRQNRRLAAFSLTCLVALGLSLLYRPHLPASQPSEQQPQRQIAPAKTTSIRVTIANAVVPAGAWKDLDAQCEDDNIKLANALQGSKYIIRKQDVVSTDGAPMITQSTKPVQSSTVVGHITTTQFAMNINMLSIAPRIDPNGSISVDVVSASTPPEPSNGSPAPPQIEQLMTSVSLRDGETKILQRSQDTMNAPVRITLITARTVDAAKGPIRRQLRHAQFRRFDQRMSEF